jgi:hypothetical protein
MRRISIASVSTVAVTALLVALGVALRLLQYAIPRSLWFDEARNAAEILKDHWLLMLPPHSAQPTPFGFLYIERGVVAVLGESELALRLFPLLAGIAALVVAARLAHQALRGFAAPFAVAMLALCGPAIYFSTEVKQYSSDLLAALLIALALASHKPETALRIALFGVLGAVLLWISYTSLFYLAVAGTLLIGEALRARDRRRIALYAGMGSAWMASFALHYRIAISHWSQTHWLTAFWSAGFPREGERWQAALDWGVSSFVAAFENPLGVTLGAPAVAAVAGLLFLVGVVASLRSGTRERPVDELETRDGRDGRNAAGDRVLVLFAGVFGLAFVCALLRIYPFKGRLLLFLLPSMAFMVARGGWWLVSAGRARSPSRSAPLVPVLALALAATLLAGNISHALRLTALEPLHRHGTVNLARLKGVEKGFEGASEVVGYVARNYQPADTVYLYYSAAPAYAYYARQLGFEVPTITGVRSQADYSGYTADLDALRGNARVWLIFSHTVAAEEEFFLRQLERMGTRLDYYRRPRANAYLFDLSRTPVPPSPQ